MEKILIVDDDSTSLLTMKAILKHQGYSCITTTNPLEAIDIFKKQTISVIVTDYEMPQMNGMELFKEIHNIRPATRGILVSSYLTFNNMIEMMELGFDDALPKPVNSTMLLNSVYRSLSTIAHWRLRIRLMHDHGHKPNQDMQDTLKSVLADFPAPSQTDTFHAISQTDIDALIALHWTT